MIGSADGGKTWHGPFGVVQNIPLPPPVYPNTTTTTTTTTFLFDQFVSFAVGPRPVASGAYPLYVAWEDYSLGVGTIVLSSSVDRGRTWSAPPSGQ